MTKQTNESGFARKALRFVGWSLIPLFFMGCGIIAFLTMCGDNLVSDQTPEDNAALVEETDMPTADLTVETEAALAEQTAEEEPVAVRPTPTPGPRANVDLVEGEGDLSFELTGDAAETYSYNVGGPTYALGVTAVIPTENGTFEVTGEQDAVEAILEDADDESGFGPWTRIWQGANEEMFPWTYFFRAQCDQPFEGHLQWHRATQLKIQGGEAGINCNIQIMRDLVSSREISPDPYSAANLKNSPLGLSWYTDGDGTTTCDGTEYTLGLEPGEISVVQMPFPHEWAGVLEFSVSVDAGHTQYLTQGEKLSDEDACTSHLD